MKIKDVPLPDVWRTCNKIRAAIFRVGLNLYDYFKPLDPKNVCLVSENQFVSVLGRQIRNLIGLSDQEISELADYFKVQDGRIFYTQFCDVIHKNVPDFWKNESLASGTEWDDPWCENSLGPTEERKIEILVTKIAASVNKRQLVLKPFFQDYELISKNCGVITIAHFGRILYFLGIVLSAEDFNLLVKKFSKDSYTINYNSFLAKIEAVQNYWEKHGFSDVGGDLLDRFPGRAIDTNLPKLPRPEIGSVAVEDIFGLQKITHPVSERKPQPEDLTTIMKRIQKHVFENRIRTTDFFQPFDRSNCGKITCNQFRRALDGMGVDGFRRLYLSEHEIWQVLLYYRDPNDSERVCWRTFADDVDQVFTVKGLEKWPERVVASTTEFPMLPKRGEIPWIDVEPEIRDLCEDTLRSIRRKLIERRIVLKPCLKDYDKHNMGRVSKAQYRQCLLLHGILLADEELQSLEKRFLDDLGFDYFRFLREIEARPIEEPKYLELVERKRKINTRKVEENFSACEKDIVAILGKLKAELVRKRPELYGRLKDHDPLNSGAVSKCDFVRALDSCGFKFTKVEAETVAEVFRALGRSDQVDYVSFVRTLEEAFTINDLERAPTIVPVPHYPSEADPRNFLNFNERQTVAVALEKLALAPESNLSEVLSGFDKEKCGSITRQQFVKALSARNMVHLVSAPERDTICKAFGFYRGSREEVDYRGFCRALDILRVNLKRKPI